MMWLTCFPELPDPGYVDNLRVLTIQADPAVAMLDTYPMPTIQVTALTVDPADEDLSESTHLWSLDIDESVEGAEQLMQIIPPEPHGTQIVLDPATMFGKGEAYVPWILPLRYRVENGDTVREAVKLVSFLFPDYDPGDDDDDDTTGDDDDSAGDDDDSAAGDDDDSAAGDDDDSAAGDDDDSAAGDDDDSAAGDDDDSAQPPPPGGQDTADDDDSADDTIHPEGYNENPVMVSLVLDTGGDVITVAEADLSIDSPIAVSGVNPDDGLRITVELRDDKDVEDVGADLYWTDGCPNLWSEMGLDLGGGKGPGSEEGTPGEDCPPVDSFGWGGSAVIAGEDKEEEDADRELGWTPLDDTGDTRLFLILLDGEGGQTWQEIRVSGG